MKAPIRPSASIGFVGLGNMGLPMAQRLVAAGYIVRGYDLSEQARADLEGSEASSSATFAEAVEGAAAVILMLPNSDVVRAVLHDEGGLKALSPCDLVIDMGSSDPLTTRSLAQEAAGLGIGFVDAPVSGGVAGARAGTLAVMMGGDELIVEACRPLLEPMSSRIFHVGDVGAGHAVKALNNLLSATSLLATSEAIAIGRGFGIDPGQMLNAINSSSGRSGSTEQKFPNFVMTETYDSGFSLRLMVKDLRAALGLGDGLGVDAPLSAESLRLWSQAADAYPAEADHTEIARWAGAGQ